MSTTNTPVTLLTPAPRRTLPGDLWGGLAAMLVALPSAIAFGVTIFAPLGGSLAAQGAMAGILGATALGLVAPAFGGSQRLITAPCAPAAAVLSALAISYTQQGIEPRAVMLMLALIGLLAGGIQIGLGFARVGQLIKFIPFPVVSGYLSGVGLIIIGSQIPKFLGAPTGSTLLGALGAPMGWSWQSIVVGTVAIVTMLLVPRITQAIPAAILALLTAILSYLGLGLLDPALMVTSNNPMLVGDLAAEGGLGDAIREHWRALSGLGLDIVIKVLVPALTLAVLLSIDTLKTCLVIDAMTNSHHESDRELIGQGLGNMASSLAGGIPGAGTMGASLINISSGGTTRASGLMSGVFSLAAFLLLAPLIAWVPVPALAAILIVIGFRMIDSHSLSFFYSEATRLDFVVIMAVILVAIFGNLIAASGVGVALAIMLFIREQTRSSVVRTKVEGHEIFSKRIRAEKELSTVERDGDDTVVFELQGSLFFGTANQLLTALEPETATRKYVILSMRRVQSLDVTATHVLEQIKDRLEENNAYLVFCDIPKGLPSGLKMKRFLKDTGVVRPTDKAFAFRQLDEALEWVDAQERQQALENTTESLPLELQDMPIFAHQSTEAVAALKTAMELRFVKAGKRVFKAGAADTDLFIIRRGTVKITVPIRKKESYHLATSSRGGIIGNMGFLDAEGHAADGLALTDTEVYVLSRANFETLAASQRGIALTVMKAVARNLSTRLRVTIQELQALRG
jgi:SulP family sulfate permease